MHPIFVSHRPPPLLLPRLTSVGATRNLSREKIQTQRKAPKIRADRYHCFLMQELKAKNYGMDTSTDHTRMAIHLAHTVLSEGTKQPYLFAPEVRNQIRKRWLAMDPLERFAATDDAYLKQKESTLQWLDEQKSQMLTELDNISEEMEEYLDQLKEIKTMPPDQIRSMMWLREDHRLRILRRAWYLPKGGLKPHIQNLIAGKLGMYLSLYVSFY